ETIRNRTRPPTRLTTSPILNPPIEFCFGGSVGFSLAAGAGASTFDGSADNGSACCSSILLPSLSLTLSPASITCGRYPLRRLLLLTLRSPSLVFSIHDVLVHDLASRQFGSRSRHRFS